MLGVQIQKNKTDAMHCGRFVFLGASRLRVEPPVPYQGYLKNEVVGWQLLAARGWRGFCFLHDYHLKSKYTAMHTKTMTAPKPVVTSRRANIGSIWAFCFVERSVTRQKEQGVLP